MENPRCFCFASNHNPLFSAAGLGVCYGAAFIEILMPSRALLSVLSEKNATWVTSFQLRQRIINVCTSALPGGCLSFCFPLYIEHTVFLCVFPKMTKQNQRRSLLVFPLSLSLTVAFLPRRKKHMESETAAYLLVITFPFVNCLLLYLWVFLFPS